MFSLQLNLGSSVTITLQLGKKSIFVHLGIRVPFSWWGIASAPRNGGKIPNTNITKASVGGVYLHLTSVQYRYGVHLTTALVKCLLSGCKILNHIHLLVHC